MSVGHQPRSFCSQAMAPKLLNKSIVIVGGTSGMGLSAALACKEAGARLVVVGRDAESTGEPQKRHLLEPRRRSPVSCAR